MNCPARKSDGDPGDDSSLCRPSSQARRGMQPSLHFPVWPDAGVHPRRFLTFDASVRRLALLCGVLDGFDDVLVSGAAAKITLERVTNFCFSWVWIGFQVCRSSHDHARRAETALQAMLFPESFLHCTQLPILGHTLDRRDGGAVRLRSKDRAALDRLAVDMDRARATGAGVTANVGASQSQGFSNEMNEQLSRLDLGVVLDPVDRDINRNDTLRYRR